MKKIKPKKYTTAKKLKCDWPDKKNLVHYRISKFHVRHGMVVEKLHEITSFKQNRLSEKYIYILLHKRKLRLKTNSKKKLYELLNNAFYGKTKENVRNRLILEFFKKDEIRK